jgi:hypothetical protein
MTFLGIRIDCVSRTLSLPEEKLKKLKTLLVSWSHKQKATKREIQSLVGKLNWAAKVVHGGRTFIRNLLNLLPKLKEPHHYIRLGVAARGDLSWWLTAIDRFHGFTPFNIDLPLSNFVFSTDACLRGGGAYFAGDWCYVAWAEDCPELEDSSINVLELRMVLEAARRWGASWSGSHILVRSDNVAAVQAINNGTTCCMQLWDIVKELFWLSVEFSFKLSALHIEGKLNILSDKLSRMHVLSEARVVKELVSASNPVLVCGGHMSYAAYLFLQNCWVGDCVNSS